MICLTDLHKPLIFKVEPVAMNEFQLNSSQQVDLKEHWTAQVGGQGEVLHCKPIYFLTALSHHKHEKPVVLRAT